MHAIFSGPTNKATHIDDNSVVSFPKTVSYDRDQKNVKVMVITINIPLFKLDGVEPVNVINGGQTVKFTYNDNNSLYDIGRLEETEGCYISTKQEKTLSLEDALKRMLDFGNNFEMTVVTTVNAN